MPGIVNHPSVADELAGEGVVEGDTMGLQLGVSVKINLEASGVANAVPPRQVAAERKSSQPLLRVAPGP